MICFQLRVRVHVDEPGRHHESGNIERVQRPDTGCRRVTHEDDAVAGHGDIGNDGLATGAIVDGTSREHEVGGWVAAGTRRESEQRQGVPGAEESGETLSAGSRGMVAPVGGNGLLLVHRYFAIFTNSTPPPIDDTGITPLAKNG